MLEMLVVISIILILLSIAVPKFQQNILHARESVLKQDLYTLRSSIDAYTLDKQRAPQSLEDLVSAGYLRVIPKDPITQQPDWVTVQEDSLMSVDQTQPGIWDVHSNAAGTASDGTAYSTW